MHGIKPHFALSAALAFLVAGCEWSGSSTSNSWSNAYDAMNFSGTYRTVTRQTSSSTTTTTTDSSGGETSAEVQYTATETKYKTSANQLNYSNLQTEHPNIVPGSVQVSLGGQNAFRDDGNGNLVSVSSSDMGSGSVSYAAGTVAFRILVPVGVVDITISYTYTVSESTGGKSTVVTTQSTSTGNKVTAITVSQSGQNLTMRLNNGIAMSGRFTTVQQTGKIDEDTSAGYNTYNAQFEVSSGGESKMVGSLNYDLASGYRTLNATWTWGKNTYDVEAVGPSWLKSAEADLNYGAVTA